MATIQKYGYAQAANTGRSSDAEYSAAISCALNAAREAHAFVLKDWSGKAADAARQAFGRFGAEMDEYQNMAARLIKAYSGTGDNYAG